MILSFQKSKNFLNLSHHPHIFLSASCGDKSADAETVGESGVNWDAFYFSSRKKRATEK